MDCIDCIQKRIDQLIDLLKKFPESIVAMLWKKELDSLNNKKHLFKNKKNSTCCK